MLTEAEALKILELPEGASLEDIKESYKRLAMLWHPERQSERTKMLECTKKFQAISAAYIYLMSGKGARDKSDELSFREMQELFKRVFIETLASNGSLSDDSQEYADDDDVDDDYFDDEDIMCSHEELEMLRRRRRYLPKDTIFTNDLPPEEISKNAAELIIEEEREKKRAEKRRAKKKRRRDKKKQGKIEVQKQEVSQVEPTRCSPTETAKPTISSEDSAASANEDDAFDPNSAFVAKVFGRANALAPSPEPPQPSVPPPPVSVQPSKKPEQKKASPTENSKEKPADKSPPLTPSSSSSEALSASVLLARRLATAGNDMASQNRLEEAIELFSEAIKYDSTDFRFYGNRSFCFEKLSQHERALRDSERAVTLAPEWPKAYFRKGRALLGLSLLVEAEEAFEHVLRLDDSCEDARMELLNVRVLRIMEMGFTREQAEAAIRKHETVPAALDSLLSSHESQPPTDRPAPFEEIVMKKHLPVRPLADDSANGLTALGLTSLWVGNVLPEVTEKKLLQTFSKCGPVASVRCLPDKYCAFVNYKTKEGAVEAMAKLQGVPCAGQNLLIRYPDHPNPNGYDGDEGCASISRSCSSMSSTVSAAPPPKPVVVTTAAAAAAAAAVSVQKATGPVNGDECYFWRTTGCQFGDQCRYKHVPAHKGLDRKPWHKPK